MSKRNGWTREFTVEWNRACRYAFRVLGYKGINDLPDDKDGTDAKALRVGHRYMDLRNAYLAGHRAGRRNV